MHFSHLSKVVIDVPGEVHDAELTFWQGALGLPMPQFAKFPEYHGTGLHHEQFSVLIQRLGDGESRVHLDIHTDNIEAEVARLEALGAVAVSETPVWRVMRDPAGLLFCVLPAPVGSLTEANAARWE